jgi:hypothetical protein
VFAVEDDGPGVPPADRERVWDRVVRLDDDRSRSGAAPALDWPWSRSWPMRTAARSRSPTGVPPRLGASCPLPTPKRVTRPIPDDATRFGVPSPDQPSTSGTPQPVCELDPCYATWGLDGGPQFELPRVVDLGTVGEPLNAFRNGAGESEAAAEQRGG